MKIYSFRFTLGKLALIFAGLLLLAFLRLLPPIENSSLPAWEAQTGPLCRVDTKGEKKIAITFETLGEGDTENLLALLEDNQVHATFFLEGRWVFRYPEETKAIAAAGHEIGTHSQTHPRNLCTLDAQSIRYELRESSSSIQALIGRSPTLFRPPYGFWNEKLMEQGNALGLETILWDVDSLDWKNRTPQEIRQTVLRESDPGSIVRFQNTAINTLSALELVLEDFQEQGYQMVTVSELLATE